MWCVDQGGGAGRNRASLGGPDGCGCVLIHRTGPFGPAGRAGGGGGRKKNQGSVGRERPGSGADAWRTMGLLKGMLEEVWRALCIASSALQVGIGQLNFNEVHSKVCSSAWAFERGARLNGNRRWEGEGGAEMSS